jgi:GGDEF domain-containing protein
VRRAHDRKVRIAPCARLALSQRLADSELGRRWILDEGNAVKRDSFFKEAKGYQRDFKRADRALYQAKNAGRNRVVAQPNA